MKTALTLIITLITLAWGWDALVAGTPSGGAALWVLRQEALYFSGLLAIALLSVAMFLATRPTWLEAPLGGMDRVYRTHRWAAILACVFAALHWLIEMSSDILKAIIGREGRVPKENFGGFIEVLRDLAEDLGEWAIYALLAMLAISLWRRFPYRVWRFLHRAMPLLYLMLAFHALLLAPTDYWTQPVGVLLAVLIAGGVYGSVLSLADASVARARCAEASLRSTTRLPMCSPCAAAWTLAGRGIGRGSSPSSVSTTAKVSIPSRSPAPTTATVKSASRSRPSATIRDSSRGAWPSASRCASKDLTDASTSPANSVARSRSGSPAASASLLSWPGWKRSKPGPRTRPLPICTTARGIATVILSSPACKRCPIAASRHPPVRALCQAGSATRR
jgi:hypothetical protein